MKCFAENELADYVRGQQITPIDMVLYCPNCGQQHIDAPETDAQYTVKLHESAWWELGGYKPERWTNPPHRSHLCHGCRCIWRPADVPTNGVTELKTAGKADTWPTHNEEVTAMPARPQEDGRG